MKALRNVSFLHSILLLTIPFFKELLLLLPLIFRKQISFSLNSSRNIIQAVLLIIICYIFVSDLNHLKLSYITIQKISPFCIAFFYSFVKIDYKYLFKFKEAVYIIFYIDFFVNVISIVLHLNIRFDPINYFDSFYHSLIGIFGHPYLSVYLSIIAFLFSYLFNDRRVKILAITSLFIVSSLRSFLVLFPIIVVFIFLARRLKLSSILLTLLLGIILVVQFVKFDSNADQSKRCKIHNIHTNQYSQCDALNSSALRYFAWNYFFDEIGQRNENSHIKKSDYDVKQLTIENIKSLKQFESGYLQAIYDYGLPLFIFYMLYFLSLMSQSYAKYFTIKNNLFGKRLYATKLAIASLFFFDTFYGVFFFCILTSLTVHLILFFESQSEGR